MTDTLTALETRLETVSSLEARLEPAGALENRSAGGGHMTVDAAVELINTVVFLPEWTFTAESFTRRFQDAVKIHVTYEARNSDRHEAPAYANWIPGGAKADFVLHVADCFTPDDLLRKLITDVIMPIQEHEAREFLRYPDTLVAPFHPHRYATMQAWGQVDYDLKFGVA